MENKTDNRWRTGGASWLIPLLLCVFSYIDSIPPWCGIVKVNCQGQLSKSIVKVNCQGLWAFATTRTPTSHAPSLIKRNPREFSGGFAINLLSIGRIDVFGFDILCPIYPFFRRWSEKFFSVVIEKELQSIEKVVCNGYT